MFDTTIGSDVNWPALILFLFMVGFNIAYGVFIESIQPKNKWPYKIFGWLVTLCLLFFLLYLSCAGGGRIQDYDEYYQLYENIEFLKRDYGYVFIEKFFKERGFDYVTYRRIYYAITFVILWISLTILRANKNIVFGCFAIFPWMFFGRQMRICMGITLMILAISLLTLKGKKRILGFIAFFPLAYLAYQVHATMLFFIIFILIGFNYKNKNYIVYTLFILGVIALVANYLGIDVISKLFEMVPESLQESIQDYATQRPNYRELNTLVFTQLAYLGSLVFARFSIAQLRLTDKKQPKDINNLCILFDACLCMFCLILTVSLSMFCIRLIRYFTIIVYAALSIAIRRANHHVLNPFVLCSIACMLIGTYLTFSFMNSWETGGFDLAFYTFFCF